MELGERLREVREDCELKMQQVYDRTGVSCTHLSRIENGKCLPRLDMLQILGTVYGKSVAELLKGTQYEERVK